MRSAAASARRPRRRTPLRRHLHDAGAAQRRGRRRRLPLPEPRASSSGSAPRGGFLEANEVHGNWYGSPRDQVREALVAGRDVILKIDVQGAQVVKEQVSEALLIFVIPPSLEELFQRLRTARPRAPTSWSFARRTRRSSSPGTRTTTTW